MKKKLIIIALFTFCYALYSQTLAKNFIDQPYIEVTGKAEQEVVPDEIYLTIEIDEKDNKAKQSLEELERSMVNTLEKMGVDIKKDLSVVDFASNFKDFLLKKKDIYTTKKFQLLCHEAKIVGLVFVELEKLNISNIKISKLDHSKIEEYRKKVKIEAMKAAKEKASYLMNSIDHEIGRAMYVQEINKRMYDKWTPSNTQVRYREYNKISLPEIEFEKIKLEYEILARFEIK